MTSNEREAQYEIQIKEYQNKSEHDAREIQDLRSQLTQSQKDKIANETRVEENINTLKQDFEQQCKELQTELNDRG
jgi:predicted  nucleic acid-binding Zn-ribbon protein